MILTKGVNRYFYAIFLLLMLFFPLPKGFSIEDYSPVELSIYLFGDGAANIDYKVDVDPTLARVNISLLGDVYENFFVKDQDGLILDYKIFEGYSTIDVLGSISVDIDYTTFDLTNKTRSLWTLILSAPVSVNIQLPEGASIMGLDPAPLSIDIVENKVSLIFSQDDITISYLLGIVGTREHSLLLIKEAEAKIEEALSLEVGVGEAEILLQEARDAYVNQQYIKAEQFASQAKDTAKNTLSMAEDARITIAIAESSIESARNADRTSLIDQAEDELQQAQDSFDSGKYEEAKTYAEMAKSSAQESESVGGVFSFQSVFLIAIILVVALIVVYRFFGKNRVESVKKEENLVEVDTESIFLMKPRLRLDEKEVIRYIASAGGEIFVSEIRDRFDIPRTSLWRMIRRLEGEEILETQTVGRETYVKISPKYALKKEKEG